MSAVRGALSGFRLRLATLRQRLARREDSEHVQALIRIGFGIAIYVYMTATTGPRFDILVLCYGFQFAAWAIFVAIIVWPQRSVFRRASWIATGPCVSA